MAYLDEFKTFPILHTPRLTLRNFRPEDGEAYLRINCDPDVQRFMGQPKLPSTPDDVQRWIANMNGHYYQKAKATICWAIETHEQQLVGRIELANFVRRSMAELAYHTDKAFWNRGFMTEAISAVLDFAFHRLGLHRIQATVHPDNVASLKVLKRHGFREEGLLRQGNFGNEFRDHFLLAILRDDRGEKGST